MARDEAGLKEGIRLIRELRDEFWRDVRVLGSADDLNQSLEKANRVSDFMELAELMCYDALTRAESCGAHLRLESQTDEGEALRIDNEYSFVSAWEYNGLDDQPILHKEDLQFENVKLTQRSYK
jgi:succinate dehydrogenase / fumarate reductase flavoprotein subunit